MDPRATQEEQRMSVSQLEAETARLNAVNAELEKETAEMEAQLADVETQIEELGGNRPEPILHKGVIKGVLKADRPAFMRLALSLRVNTEFIENRMIISGTILQVSNVISELHKMRDYLESSIVQM